MSTKAAANEHYNTVLINGPRDPHLVVFESMLGMQFSDGPRAIYEEMLRQELPATMVWSVDPAAPAFPSGIPSVVRGSTEWYETLARAHVWVENQNFAPNLRKPEGTLYVQTWHGTPLKTLGFNNESLAAAPQAKRDRHTRAVARWDVVPVPSDYFTETVVRAHGSDATCLPIGSPRNDRLVRPDLAEQLRIRRSLGIDPDDEVILFAPTRVGPQVARQQGWQSIDAPAAGSVHLVRGHYTDAREGIDVLHAGARDVSTVPDMADLLLIADMLVTDYSSSMYDYALLDRPIVVFQPDSRSYAEARGTYYDIIDFPPGPLVSESAQLRDLLTSSDIWSTDWAERRSSYRERFCTYEQGTAARRLVDEHIRPVLAA